MTTNAIDKSKGIIASDSRWSIEHGEHIAFVDNTGFDKIADREYGSIICAGDARLIEEWRDWFLAPRLNTAALPRTERVQNGNVVSITISVIQKPGGIVLYSTGWYLTFEEAALFSGSGAQFARDCYSVNRCSRTAVETAGGADPATGGETKWIELATSRHNLSPNMVRLADAEKQFLDRGMIMNTRTKTVVPLKDFQAANGAASAVTAANLSLSAPTGQPHRPWSDAEKEGVRKAMERIAALEDEAKGNDA